MEHSYESAAACPREQRETRGRNNAQDIVKQSY